MEEHRPLLSAAFFCFVTPYSTLSCLLSWPKQFISVPSCRSMIICYSLKQASFNARPFTPVSLLVLIKIPKSTELSACFLNREFRNMLEHSRTQPAPRQGVVEPNCPVCVSLFFEEYYRIASVNCKIMVSELCRILKPNRRCLKVLTANFCATYFLYCNRKLTGQRV